MKKLTNSQFNRGTYDDPLKNTARAINDIKHKESRSITKVELKELNKQIQANTTYTEEERIFLLRKFFIAAQKPVFVGNFFEHITNTPFVAFHVGVHSLPELLAIKDQEITEVVQLTTRTLGETLLKNPSTRDCRGARGSTEQLVLHVFELAKKNRISLKTGVYFAELVQIWEDAIDVQTNISENRIVYLDKELAITWFPSSLEDNKKFRSSGEISIAVRLPNGLWTFDKYSDNRIPLTSLRAARKACQNWKGQNMKGKITHEEAVRISRFLGFQVIDEWAYLKSNAKTSKGGFGKKN
jgi:hypothetical protein